MAPDAFGGDYGAYVNLGAIYYLLELNKTPEAIDQAQQRMWDLALHLEEGQTERTARALEEARQAARDALDKAIREPNEANREALDQRLKELEQAIEQHLQALAEEARRNNDEMPFDPNAQHLSNRDLDQMAEQAREAAREGRMDEAQQRMAELERMLDRLRNARAEHGRDGERTAGAAPARPAADGCGAGHDRPAGRPARSLAGPRRRDDAASAATGPPPRRADENADREADRRVQQALRRALGELMQQFGDLTGEVPPSLSEADQAMRDARKQLGEGNDQGAGASEQKAVEALQKGGREMGQAMAKQFGPQQGQDGSDQEGDSDGPMGLDAAGRAERHPRTRLASGSAGSGAAGSRSARPPLWPGQFRRR